MLLSKEVQEVVSCEWMIASPFELCDVMYRVYPGVVRFGRDLPLCFAFLGIRKVSVIYSSVWMSERVWCHKSGMGG